MFVLLLPASLLAQEVPEYQGFVNDYTGTLSPTQRNQLESLLVQIAEQTSNEIAIALLTLPEGAVLEEYTLQVAETWGVGGSQNDNGILIAVYPSARKMRIEVGYGLEGAIPDSRALEIMDTKMKPAFRAGDYYTGLRDAAETIYFATQGEYENAPRSKYYSGSGSSSGRGGGGQIVVIIMIIILFSILGRGGGKGGGGRGGGGFWSILPWILLSGGGGHRGGGGFGGGDFGGGGGFGGGGFGGFGGGGFGGGGASSSW